MTVNEVYKAYLDGLEKIYSRGEVESIAALVFESMAGINRAAIKKDRDRLLDVSVVQKLTVSLKKLKLNTPVQYVLGEAWFSDLKFIVSPAVLIPRPETEELVLKVINYLKDWSNASLLDIGTGSGCIPISIKKILPHLKVTAIDKSIEALAIARENATIYKTGIDLFQNDFLDEAGWNNFPVFDVIVSNPPYIPFGEKEMIDKNVADFEPAIALFVEDDRPLIFYEKIARFGKQHLKTGGKIFVETHELFAEQVDELFENAGYISSIELDMHGKQRMVIATRPGQ
ncbi:MAG: peptide chain release factor N(5)-glutamine methyltransferase [Ferruginibacter sp.]